MLVDGDGQQQYYLVDDLLLAFVRSSSLVRANVDGGDGSTTMRTVEDGVRGRYWFACPWFECWFLRVIVCVGDDGSLVRERGDCLVEAVAWYESSVVGRWGRTTIRKARRLLFVGGDGQQQYYLVDDLLLAFVRSGSLVRERRDSVNSSLVGERGDSVDSSLVGERVYCLVEAVGCCWSAGTGNNNITYNS